MRDLKLAKEIMNNEGLTLALVKDEECFFKSKERGIKPLYIALMNNKEKLKGASAADKIVGKGAALLYIKGEVKNIYAKVISKNSVQVLEKQKIFIDKEIMVPYIKNRDKSGMCPIETMAEEDENIESLLSRIEIFLKVNKLI